MKKVLFTILFLLTSLGYQQFVDQKIALASIPKERLNLFEKNLNYQPGLMKVIDLQKGMLLFAKKCSECHELDRALTLYKDPRILEKTIRKMQSYSKGAITEQQTKELVDFNVSEQQREIIAFKETCTQCHGDKRIDNRTLSPYQWLETVKRMQQKSSDLISDEKKNLQAAYFHRRDLTMAKIFYGNCQLCHLNNSGPRSTNEINGLIVLAKEELGQSLQINNVRNLLSIHVQRQKKIMQLYESNCITCHPSRLSAKNKSVRKKIVNHSRVEWISFIALLQGEELSKEVQNTINSQIGFHIAKH